MSRCVIPGSFDPVTLGHEDLIRRAAEIFDRVTVVVMVNIRKKSSFSAEERVRMLETTFAGDPRIRVEAWDGLLSGYMREKGERTVIRGARTASEFDAEFASAQANRALNPEMETLLLPAGEGKQWLSSSAVREIAAFGGDIQKYVPAACAEEIQRRLSNH